MKATHIRQAVLVSVAALILLTGCEYPYFLRTRYNDSQLSCEEIKQQIAAVDQVIDRGFAEEYGPLLQGLPVVIGIPVGTTLNEDRRASKASAIERRKVLLSLKSEQCDKPLSPANPTLQGTGDEAARL